MKRYIALVVLTSILTVQVLSQHNPEQQQINLQFLFELLDIEGRPNSTEDHVANEEVWDGAHLPEYMQCDACYIISHVMYTAFDAYNERYPHFKYKLPESHVIDLLESLCAKENAEKIFGDYGQKNIGGKYIISGYGVATDQLPGFFLGGGAWPFRLARVCDKFREEVDDISIYKLYQKKPYDEHHFTHMMCFQKGRKLRDACFKNAQKIGKKRKQEL